MANNKIYGTVIIVLLVLVLGLGGYIAYEKVFLTTEEDPMTSIGDVDIDLNAFYQISNTLNSLDSVFNDSSSSYFGQPYGQKRVLAKDLNDSLANYIALQGILLKTGKEQTIPGDVVKSRHNNIFGDNKKYMAKSIDDNGNKINYLADSNSYKYTLTSTDEYYKSGYVTYNQRTSLTADKVIIKRKIFYVDYSTDTGVVVASIYKNNNKTQYLGKITLSKGVLNPAEVIGKYGSRIMTYEYIFTKEGRDEYTFYSIEQSK